MKQVTFGERLKLLREQHGLTLREFSEKINISYSALGNYERNVREPSFEILFRIAEFFKVDVGYLLGVNQCKNSSNNLAVSKLGLTEDSINKISNLDPELCLTLSHMIENNHFNILLMYLNQYQTEFLNKSTAQKSFEDFLKRYGKLNDLFYAVENVKDYEFLIYSNLQRAFEAIVNRLKL